MKRLVNFWVYSNLHMALIAALLGVESNVLFNQKIEWAFPVFLFFSTLFIYNLGYADELIWNQNTPRKQSEWLKRNKSYWAISILMSLIGISYSITWFSWVSQVFFGICGIVAFIYVRHSIAIGRLKLTLRNIPYLKVFIVSVVWASVTVIPLYISFGKEVDPLVLVWLLCERLLFVLAITFMFDVRDIDQDDPALKTLPQVWGIYRTKLAAGLALFISLILLNFSPLSTIQYLFILVVYFLTAVAILKTNARRSELYFTGFLDGLIGIHALAILLPIGL